MRHGLAVVLHPDDGVEGVVAQLGDDDFADLTALRPRAMFCSRSCVIGRGVAVFSSSSAMALASKMPTQMGSTSVAGYVLEHDDGHVGERVDHQAANLHLDSRPSPRRVGRTSLVFGRRSSSSLATCLAYEAVGKRLRDPDREIAAHGG